MGLSVGDALNQIRNKAAMLSWLMQMAQSGDDPDDCALLGASDVCDDLTDLAERVARTFGGQILDTPVIEWNEDEGPDDSQDPDDDSNDEEDEESEAEGDEDDAHEKLTREFREELDRLRALSGRLRSWTKGK